MKKGCTFRLASLLGRLIDNGRMFEAAEVKHSDATICPTRNEDVNAVSTESNIKDLLVMGYELSFCSQSRYVPYGARGINTRSDY